MDMWRWLDDLRTDLRFGVRGLARNPVFTTTAALVLSIGIGGTAAMFSATNAFLFRPFPAPDPGQLVVVAPARRAQHLSPIRCRTPSIWTTETGTRSSRAWSPTPATERFCLAPAPPGRPLSSMSVATSSRCCRWTRRSAARSCQTRDANPATRRSSCCLIAPGGTVSAPTRRWSAAVVRLGTTAHTVIGVTPESFVFTDQLFAPELYAPITRIGLVGADRGYAPVTQTGRVGADRGDPLRDWNREWCWLMGRLRSGVSVAEARANLSVLTTALATAYPDSMEHSELWVELERRARPFPAAAPLVAPMMTLVMGLASLVLLIACANVGTLLIGRGLGRQWELVLRAGLGATRLRLIRQLISESVLLALLGGTGGALAALWATNLLSTFDIAATLGSAWTLDVTMDWRGFAFTAVAAVLTGLTAGVAPALRASRVDLTRAIGQGGRGASRGATGQRLTSGLVVAQVAMSLVLLVCAGLFVRSGQKAATLDVGFRTDAVLLATVDPLTQGYAPEQARRFFRDIADEVEALPGVKSASWARNPPQTIYGSEFMRVVTLDGGAIPETDPVLVYTNDVDRRSSTPSASR